MTELRIEICEVNTVTFLTTILIGIYLFISASRNDFRGVPDEPFEFPSTAQEKKIPTSTIAVVDMARLFDNDDEMWVSPNYISIDVPETVEEDLNFNMEEKLRQAIDSSSFLLEEWEIKRVQMWTEMVEKTHTVITSQTILDEDFEKYETALDAIREDRTDMHQMTMSLQTALDIGRTIYLKQKGKPDTLSMDEMRVDAFYYMTLKEIQSRLVDSVDQCNSFLTYVTQSRDELLSIKKRLEDWNSLYVFITKDGSGMFGDDAANGHKNAYKLASDGMVLYEDTLAYRRQPM